MRVDERRRERMRDLIAGVGIDAVLCCSVCGNVARMWCGRMRRPVCATIENMLECVTRREMTGS
jgi:hypothetical protein